MTGLVFGKLFFPRSDPLVGMLQAFAIYAVGFVARPVGAAIFGHYGDRIGRKAALITTLLLTGLATFAVGFVPTYEQIGIWGAVILTIIRFIQGLGVGGEWGGSVLLSMEWARSNAHRGFIVSWPQFGAPAGFFLANFAVLVFSAISGDQFLSWGWRVPFLLSIVMVGVGLYIRLGILETPTFSRLVAENRIERAPVVEVIKRQPKSIILVALATMAEMAPAYVYSVFVLTAGTTVLGNLARPASQRSHRLSCHVMLYSPHRRVSVGSHRPQAHVSDRRGRNRCVRVHLLPAAQHQSAELDLPRHRVVFGPARPYVRSAGRVDRGMLHPPPALQRRLARLPACSIVAGGPAPLIATALLAAFGSGYPIAVYILFCAIVSVVATVLLPDYTNRDISQEYA